MTFTGTNRGPTTMTDIPNETLAECWRQLWNGDASQLDSIVTDNFIGYAALMGGIGDDVVRGRAALGQ